MKKLILLSTMLAVILYVGGCQFPFFQFQESDSSESSSLAVMMGLMPEIRFAKPASLVNPDETGYFSKADEIVKPEFPTVGPIQGKMWNYHDRNTVFFAPLADYLLQKYKTYIIDHNIKLNDFFSYQYTPEETLYLFKNYIGGPDYPLPDNAKTIITGIVLPEGHDFRFYSTIRFSYHLEAESGEISTMMLELMNNAKIKVEGTHIKLDAVTEFNMIQDGAKSDLGYLTYLSFDNLKNSGEMVSHRFDNGLNLIVKTVALDNSDIAIFSRSSDVYLSVGNNSYGAVMYGIFWGTSVFDEFTREYYDNHCNLLAVEQGSFESNTGSINYDSFLNLYSYFPSGAPVNIYTKFQNGNWLFTDNLNAPNWISWSQYSGFIWDNSENNGWTAGDCIYGFDSFYESSTEGSIYVFKKKLTMESKEKIDNSEFIVNEYYPLSRLLPLKSNISEFYKIATLELGTEYWHDATSVEGNDTTYYWTNYDYFLDSLSSGVSLQKDPGELSIGPIAHLDTFRYVSGEYKEIKVPYYAVNTEIPEYLNSPDFELINKAKVLLQSQYNDYFALSIDQYLETLDSLDNSISYFK